ncbi:MAG: hypothetical protein E6Q68_03705 [Polynucleobacter sp.]|nr:MAG: hypothetical protein E6Q68_03705 [Polynucleobacter sp.]
MKKLIELMTGGSDNKTLIKRATDQATRIKLEQESLLNDLNRQLMEKRAKLDQTLDLGPDQTTSLRSTAFDPKALVNEVQTIKVEILELEIQIKVATDTLTDWTSEDK